jgi:excisionase family DNA binding protein
MADRPTTTTQARRYASLDEAAEYLGCGARTIRRMIAAGEITGYRVGKRMLRVDLDDVDATMRPIPSAREAS